ncbi:hypothetical protein P3547_19815 [Vibrio parahaemolyticus]|nr:hypothetical protein [Vibrio parahaemolyticus]
MAKVKQRKQARKYDEKMAEQFAEAVNKSAREVEPSKSKFGSPSS